MGGGFPSIGWETGMKNAYTGFTMKSCMPKSTKVYAIRMGEFVEFRRALRKPEARVSKFIRNVKETQYETVEDPKLTARFGYPYYKHVPKEVLVKKVMKQTFFVGGKVLGFCKYDYFLRRAKGYKLGVDGIVEVPASVKTDCLIGGVSV